MGTNTSIYGEQTDWVATGSSGSGHADPNDNYYFANFGSSTSYDVSTLKAAVDNGKFALNTPIDKSISWCGLGRESMFSNIESYNNKVWEDEEDPFKMMNKDARGITNFGLFGKASPWTLASPSVSSWYYSDATAQTYASRARWAPEAGDGTSSTTSNFNMGLMPITQLPMRNCVAIPVIECRTAIDVSPNNSGATRAYAWEYFNPASEINYTNHPYITAIGMQFWGTPSDDYGGNRSSRLSGIHIAVLDETDVCKGQSFDVEQPTRVQDTTYQYYAMGRTYSTMSQRPGMGMTIMGLLSTNSETMILPHANGYQRKSRGNIVIPHPNGKLGYVNNPSTATGVGDWVYYYVEYYDGLKEWIRQQIACFGLFFTDDEQTALNGELDDDKMFLGILIDGIGHGDYSHGEDNKKQPQWNWATTNQSPYDPNNPPPDPDVKPSYPDTNPILPTTPGFTLAGKGTQCYGITYLEMSEIMEDIFGSSDASYKELIEGLAMFGSNPMNAFISLKWYPFLFSSPSKSSIILGSTVVNDAHTYDILNSVNTTFKEFTASCEIKIDNNFVNSRRSKAQLYLPFYGFYELPMNMLMSQTVSISFRYNVPDAMGLWVISFGSKIYDFVECDPSIEVPLTGDNHRDIMITKRQIAAQNAIKAAMVVTLIATAGVQGVIGGEVASAASTGAAAAGQGVGSAIAQGISSGLANFLPAYGKQVAATVAGSYAVQNKITNLSRTLGNLQVNVPSHGASDATTFLNLGMEPYIVIYTPKTIEDYKENEYKLKVGIACDKWVTAAEMPENSLLKTGGMANMSTSGMELAEVQELNGILQTGFYR